ncbi:hypothetical protein [Methylobacterium iners]|uniref:Uncharacterized protein n=1 Tax=Methylobacterium iners TaxID=418707 RepID=A0ABQ4RRQ4_9HYPH|nr:hypothetical protein [Methylobacterium iners]GJD92884.1 hypothetical protein OCOJLMKI_0067 [Methylobacterium iners]
MSAALDQIPPAVAAQWLHDRFVSVDSVAQDTRMAEHLFEVFRANHARRNRAPTDFDAVRAELAKLQEER